MAPFSVSATSVSPGAVTYSVISGPRRYRARLSRLRYRLRGPWCEPGSKRQLSVGGCVDQLCSGSGHSSACVYADSDAEHQCSSIRSLGDLCIKRAVTYSVVSGPATLSGSTVTLTGAGTVVLSASQAAAGNYGPATASASFTVSASTTPVLTFVSVPTQAYGAAPFIVSATSPSPGAITYSVVSGPATISGSTVTITGVGPVVLGANQAASGTYTAASASTSFTVAPATPALVFGPIATQAVGAAPFVVLATSASSGVVTYSVVSGPATVSSSTVTVTGAGTVVVWASQAASGNYGPATASTSFAVTSLTTPVLVFAPVGSQVFGAASFAVSATSASPGAVTYSVVSGPATISGSTVTTTGIGTVVLGANQSASGTYSAATASTNFSVTTATPVLAFVPVSTQTVGAAPFAVSATSISAGAVTYSVVSGPAAVSGSTVTLTGAGTVVLGASQAANGNYGPATASTSFVVNPFITPLLTFNPIGTQTFGVAPFGVSATVGIPGCGDLLGGERTGNDLWVHTDDHRRRTSRAECEPGSERQLLFRDCLHQLLCDCCDSGARIQSNCHSNLWRCSVRGLGCVGIEWNSHLLGREWAGHSLRIDSDRHRHRHGGAGCEPGGEWQLCCRYRGYKLWSFSCGADFGLYAHCDAAVWRAAVHGFCNVRVQRGCDLLGREWTGYYVRLDRDAYWQWFSCAQRQPGREW